jgi:hypothetical protein
LRVTLHATFPALATSNPARIFRLREDVATLAPTDSDVRDSRIRLSGSRTRCGGRAPLVRFADDLVMTFETYHDAKRVMNVLGEAARTVRPHAPRGEITGAG